MTRFFASLSLGAALLSLAVATPVLAADNLVVTSASTTTAPIEGSGPLPNPFLLRSGMFTLGAAYVPALVVAIESERTEDNHLYVPVVGPWLDLAARNDCSGNCSGETLNKALLVTDGVFQGLGALQVLGSFVLPETPAVALRNSDGSLALAVSVAPAHLGRGANGVMAVGRF
ncbi:MAG: hypothetical protein RL033_837 [Pseudomonadota bacterium]|jgi:hypothetical protein